MGSRLIPTEWKKYRVTARIYLFREWHKCPRAVAVRQFVARPSKVRQARLKVIPPPRMYFLGTANDLTLRSS
jgi:hypothetical protein